MTGIEERLKELENKVDGNNTDIVEYIDNTTAVLELDIKNSENETIQNIVAWTVIIFSSLYILECRLRKSH